MPNPDPSAEPLSTRVRVGLGLWGMRSTARHPASTPALYRRVLRDAETADRLGFDSLWLSEHRFWYDGWCPQPLLAAAGVAAVTRRLRVGTAMMLLPQHDARHAAEKVRTVETLTDGRLELGVGLGYRAEEYAGMGLSMRHRGKRMEQALDELQQRGARAPIWIGGMAAPAIRRAARRGLGLLLPPTLTLPQVHRVIDLARQEAEAAGARQPRIGMLRDVWMDEDGAAARAYFLPRLRHHYREYVTAWWAQDRQDPPSAGRIRKQVERNVSTAVAGTPEEVERELRELTHAGVELLVLQIHNEETAERSLKQMRTLAHALLPSEQEATCA